MLPTSLGRLHQFYKAVTGDSTDEPYDISDKPPQLSPQPLS